MEHEFRDTEFALTLAETRQDVANLKAQVASLRGGGAGEAAKAPKAVATPLPPLNLRNGE